MTRSCRFCAEPLVWPFADLGLSPLANGYLRAEDLSRMEPFYPLDVRVCESCLLVQLPVFESPERIFDDYAYLSSYSETWLAHAADYARTMVPHLALGPHSLVVEIGSNDGYLLQHMRAAGIPALGIEPARPAAAAAEAKGIETIGRFFGAALAHELVGAGREASLIIGNNVLAHVPTLNDFVEGLRILLAHDGLITLEFPHLLRLMAGRQFDTIYHEHFSYFSLLAARRIFAAHGLTIVKVEELPTHGGSLRIWARHTAADQPVDASVAAVERQEHTYGLHLPETYAQFANAVRETKRSLLAFLIRAKNEGRTIAAYGAPAKGNTLLNYCGVRSDFIDYTVDRNPRKQGLFLPGTHIPIHAPERLSETRPDYVLILPWNLKDEILEQMQVVREWGGRFVVPVPHVAVLQ